MSLFDLRELTILIKVSLFVLRGIPIYQRLAKYVPIRNKQSSNTNTYITISTIIVLSNSIRTSTKSNRDIFYSTGKDYLFQKREFKS